MHQIKRDKIFWDSITVSKDWGGLQPPWRPSREDIENFRSGVRLCRSKTKKILILGSTPELRDLAAQLSENVWIIDYSFNMLREMGKLVKFADFNKEKWIIDDWCRCEGLQNNFFDIILGDLVLRLVSPDKQEIFLEKISNLLHPRGFFINRVHFINDSFKKKSPGKIIHLTLALFNQNMPDGKRYTRNLLVSRLLDKNSFFLIRQKIRREARRNIHEYLKNRPKIDSNSREILKGALDRFGENGIPLSSRFCADKKMLEKKIKQFFFIKKRLIARDYNDAEYFPVDILSPKHL